jgi:hypothetical protein
MSFAGTLNYFRANPGIQSHDLIDPAQDLAVNLIGYDKPAKSLVNAPGGVETNNRPGGVIQVEIVGYAAAMATMPDSWYATLARQLDRISVASGVPVAFPCPFVAYPTSYGLNAPQRLSGTDWATVTGWVGHQHVPENLHGDPGDINRLIPLMTQPEGPTMPPSIADLGSAMATIQQLYINHRGSVMSLDERASWGKDIEAKLAGGADLGPTYEYIAWALDQGA